MLYISREFEAGSAVADDGTGFQGELPDDLARPFFARKPDGLG